MPSTPTNHKSIQSLIDIVAALRGPQGCPWDKEQTHQSLIQFAIEEVYEFIEAIENQDDNSLKEELGDVLFQVALHSQIAKERNAFTIGEVIETLNEKMIRRHPHVFSNEIANTKDEVLAQWEVIKAKERENKKKSQTSNPFSIPKALPSLQRSFKIGQKTNKVGFDWNSHEEVKLKILEELNEIDEALLSLKEEPQLKEDPQLNENKTQHLEEEIGDLLFTVAQYSRHLGFEPESCLRKSNLKFEKRYSAMLNLSEKKGLSFNETSPKEKEELWNQVKQNSPALP